MVQNTNFRSFPFKWNGAVVHPVVPTEDEIDSKGKEESEWVKYVDAIAVVFEPPVQSIHGVGHD